MNIFRRSPVFGVLVVCAGCAATDVGNPQTGSSNNGVVEEESSAEVLVTGFERETPNALTLDDGLELTHAWITVSESHFVSACDTELEEEESEPETEVEGEEEIEDDPDSAEPRQESAVVADLVSGTVFPAPIRLRQPGREFCQYRFVIAPSEAELPAGAPADMAGYSVVVRGTLKDGTPFVVRSELDADIVLEGDIELEGDASNFESVILGFAVNGWLTQRELGAAVGNGEILIDDENNDALLESFETAVEAAPALYRDVDQDGGLSPTEAQEPVAVTLD